MKFFNLKNSFSLILPLLVVLFFTACSKSESSPTPKNTTSTLSISSLSVSSGSYTTSVTITGTGFSPTAIDDKLFFNGVAAVVSVASATQLQTRVPLAAGTGNITITINGSTATGPVFTYQPTEIETTIAGGNTSGSANGIGPAATFFQPNGIAVDPAGNLYVADQNNNLIRKITPAGLVSTFAGSGVAGSADGTGTAASFNFPTGIAIDGAGNVYVSDMISGLIRKITPSGVVSTLAGSGLRQAVNGTGKAASFSNPVGLAVDASGNVFVADQGASQIRKITPAGVVTTFYSGNGINPYGLTLDKAGNIYVTDLTSNDIIKITPNGVATVFAGNSNIAGGDVDGTGNNASFYYPDNIAIDATGNLFVIDKNGIREITPASVVTTLKAGSPVYLNGPLENVDFTGAEGIAVDGTGNIYFTDLLGNSVRKISYQ